MAATIAAPTRALYSATKAAAFMAVESCRVECEGSGVRFFCKSPHLLYTRLIKALIPGTIANGFRLKHAVNNGGGVDETQLDIRHNWEKLLLKPEDGKHLLIDGS